MTLVACFGKIPRFCRFDPELFETFELKSSLIESISSPESPSSELLHGDNWSAKWLEKSMKIDTKTKSKENVICLQTYMCHVADITYYMDLLVMGIQFDWAALSLVFVMKSSYYDLESVHRRPYYQLTMLELLRLTYCLAHWWMCYGPV